VVPGAESVVQAKFDSITVPASLQPRDCPKDATCKLLAPGWNETARTSLETLINKGAGQGLPVVFDFDNTLICGDVSEATLAVLVNSGKLNASRLPETLSPPFRTLNQPRRTLASSVDLTAYYQAFLSPTVHLMDDPSPASNGYVWAVEVMAGLTPQDVVEATREAYKLSRPVRPAYIEVTPGQTSYPVPYFYPEMVELVAELLRQQFDIWIVSAGNVWSIRWMIAHVLNPMLREFGLAVGVGADHIIGVTTLLADSNDNLYKDTVLVRQNSAYAQLEERCLRSFHLTSRLEFPVPVYAGKVASLLDALPRPPYLCVGDAPGDHRMLAYSENRLWIARLDKPAFLKATLGLLDSSASGRWIFQPTHTSEPAGFIPNLARLPFPIERASQKIFESISLLPVTPSPIL
jgi:hypothetical protein